MQAVLILNTEVPAVGDIVEINGESFTVVRVEEGRLIAPHPTINKPYHYIASDRGMLEFYVVYLGEN